MRKEELISKIADVIFENSEDMQLETELDELAGWDSVGRLGVIGLFNELFDKKVEIKDIKKCETVEDLVNLVNDELEA